MLYSMNFMVYVRFLLPLFPLSVILKDESSLGTLLGHSQNIHAEENVFSNIPEKYHNGRPVYAVLELNCAVHPTPYF